MYPLVARFFSKMFILLNWALKKLIKSDHFWLWRGHIGSPECLAPMEVRFFENIFVSLAVCYIGHFRKILGRVRGFFQFWGVTSLKCWPLLTEILSQGLTTMQVR